MKPSKTAKEIAKINRTRIAACGAFKMFLPLERSSTILVKDDHFLGGVSLSLTHNVKHIICICKNNITANLVKKRIEKIGQSNIKIVIGDIENLPFKNEMFDAVCYHALKVDENSKKRTAIEVNTNVHKCLKPSGLYYLSYDFDCNSAESFFSQLLIKMRIVNKSTLKGFKTTKILEHYLSFSYLHLVKLIDKFSSLGGFISYVKCLFFRENIGFILRKNIFERTTKKSLIELIQLYIENNYGLLLSTPDLLRIGSTGSLVGDFGNYIIRFPQTPDAVEHCKVNFKALKNIQTMGFSVEVPTPVLEGSVNGQPFFVESKIEGLSTDLFKISKEDSTRIVNQAYQLIANKKFVTGLFNEEIFNDLIKNEIEQLSFFLNDQHSKIMKNLIEYLYEDFLINELVVILTHGDYKFSNFICSNNNQKNLMGLIDWEFSSNLGLPLFDLFMMLAWNVKPWSEYESRIVKRFENLSNPETTDRMILSYMEKMKIEKKLLKPLAIVFMIKYLNSYFYTEIKQTKIWYEEMIEETLMPTCNTYLSDSQK